MGLEGVRSVTIGRKGWLRSGSLGAHIGIERTREYGKKCCRFVWKRKLNGIVKSISELRVSESWT